MAVCAIVFEVLVAVLEQGTEWLWCVVDDVGVVDGADGAVATGDVASDGGDDGLVGVSLAYMPVSQMLGGSVDVLHCSVDVAGCRWVPSV